MKKITKNASKLQDLALPKQSSVKPIVYAGLCVLTLSVSLYVYFVGKIVFDVVGRRTAEASAQASESDLSSLEVAYFNTAKSFTIAQAESMGLSPSNDMQYATRQTPTPATLGVATES